jgi:hypothetical protein
MPSRDRVGATNQARLSATATNDAPSTMVVVATTIATTRVQAKILDCSNVTRLTTRAKRRVRMNNSLHNAWHAAATCHALLFSSGAIQSHIFAKRKTQIHQTKDLSAASMQKGRSRAQHHPFGGP